MTRLPLPDRLGRASLALIAAAHVVFFLFFVAVAMLASTRARAETPACTGHDIVAELEKSDPALLNKVRAEAAEIPNNASLLWRVEKTGRPPSWLFGTMHVTDPRVVALTPAAQDAFDQAKAVVIETTDILEPAKLTAALMQRSDLFTFADATTLKTLLSPVEFAAVEKGLDERGVPIGTVLMMKPWMLSTMLALPACENARKAAGAVVLDQELARQAQASGKTLGGLETGISQLEAMASLPMRLHVGSLVETARLGHRMDDIFETMIVLYQEGQAGLFMPLVKAVVPETLGTEAADYADFEETMIVRRNRGMAASAEKFLAGGGAFVAVGALHLPGPEGLVELLRQAGYTVIPAG